MTDDYSARLKEVQALQAQMGMEPRCDSRLTEQYANGHAEPEFDTAYKVAHELVMTDYIYRTTLYSQVIEEVMRNVAGWLKKRYKLTWTDAWEITRFYAPTMIKLQCMIASGQDFRPVN